MNNISLSWINEMAKKCPQEFIQEEDEKYYDRIKHAADVICQRRQASPIVLLSGPSGSGKTTTAKKLEAELERRGINSHTISMDDYFVTLDPKTAPRTPDGNIDFESPACVDMELLSEHFTKLANGEEIHIPYFMFARQKRSASRFTPMRLKENEVAIFEGIHALNDDITERHPDATKLYICAMSNVEDAGREVFKNKWTRLIRRTVRDSKFRGADAAMTLRLWKNVLRGEELYIYPYVYKADVQINSSLGYEIPVMKKYAEQLLEDIEKDMEYIGEADEILRALHVFNEIDEKLVDEYSLMREFIGGGIYDY